MNFSGRLKHAFPLVLFCCLLSVVFAAEGGAEKILVTGTHGQSSWMNVEDFLRGLVVVPDLPTPLKVELEIQPGGAPAVFSSGQYNPQICFSANQDAHLLLFHVNAKGQLTLMWPDIVEDPSLQTFVPAGRQITIPRIFRFFGDYQGREFFQVFAFQSLGAELRDMVVAMASQSREDLVYVATNPLFENHVVKDFKRESTQGWASNMVDYYFNIVPQFVQATFGVPASPYWFLDGMRVDQGYVSLSLAPGEHLVQYYQGDTLFRKIVEVNRPGQMVHLGETLPPPSPTSPSVPRQRKVFSFLVGISAYPGDNYLSTPARDARGLSEALSTSVRKEGGVFDSKVLLDSQATRGAIASFLESGIFSHIDQETDVLIFFSGHGYTTEDLDGDEEDGVDEMLVPIDFRPVPGGLDPSSCLVDDDLSVYFRQIAASSRNLFVVLDSCFAGSAQKGIKGFVPLSGTKNFVDVNKDALEGELGQIRDNFLFLASSKGDQKSWADPLQNLNYSLFTYFLLEGIRGEADRDYDGMVDAEEIFAFVSERVPRWVRENIPGLPPGAPVQMPVFENPSERKWMLKY